MPSQEDIEKRIEAVVSDPGNQSCSECGKEDFKAQWAAFLTVPVDRAYLGVLCCKKCYKLFNKVEGADFTLRSLEDLSDWTGDDIDALELGGNKLVNACYEAGATKKEKEKILDRKSGEKAWFFEKHVNLAYFDEVLYKNVISQASKALVEKRFNKSLRGYNLKKTAAEDEDNSHSFDDENIDESTSSQGEYVAPQRSRRGIGVQRAHSARGLQGRRQLSNRRLRSARNVTLDQDKEEKTGSGHSRPNMSRQRLNSIRRELMDDGGRKTPTKVKSIADDDNGPGPDGRVRRQLSARRLSARNLMDAENGAGGGGGGGMRRGGSRTKLMDGENGGGGGGGGGMRRSGSRTKIQDGGNDRRGNMRNGRHRLSQRNIVD